MAFTYDSGQKSGVGGFGLVGGCVALTLVVSPFFFGGTAAIGNLNYLIFFFLLHHNTVQPKSRCIFCSAYIYLDPYYIAYVITLQTVQYHSSTFSTCYQLSMSQTSPVLGIWLPSVPRHANWVSDLWSPHYTPITVPQQSQTFPPWVLIMIF